MIFLCSDGNTTLSGCFNGFFLNEFFFKHWFLLWPYFLSECPLRFYCVGMPTGWSGFERARRWFISRRLTGSEWVGVDFIDRQVVERGWRWLNAHKKEKEIFFFYFALLSPFDAADSFFGVLLSFEFFFFFLPLASGSFRGWLDAFELLDSSRSDESRTWSGRQIRRTFTSSTKGRSLLTHTLSLSLSLSQCNSFSSMNGRTTSWSKVLTELLLLLLSSKWSSKMAQANFGLAGNGSGWCCQMQLLHCSFAVTGIGVDVTVFCFPRWKWLFFVLFFRFFRVLLRFRLWNGKNMTQKKGNGRTIIRSSAIGIGQEPKNLEKKKPPKKKTKKKLLKPSRKET